MAEDGGHGARNEGESLVVIANPRAGGGRAGARKAEIEAAVSRSFARSRVVWTTAAGHATALAREAAEQADIVAALGGDGTCHEVVNGLFAGTSPVRRSVVFAAIPFGTGGDLVRSLKVPTSLERALWVASTGMTLHLDVGRVEWGEGRSELFINVAGLGANAEVCRLANQSSKRFGGRVTFLSSILRTLRSYTPRRVRWRFDTEGGVVEHDGETLAAFCANAHYCGAGLFVGKGGDLTDGFFDVTVLPRIGILEAVRFLPAVYDGSFGGIPGVFQVRARAVEVQDPVPMELDGEPVSDAPVRLSVLPRALQVRGGWIRPPGTGT